MPRSPPAELWETVVPFHKLTQWLCYSLMVPMTKLLQIHFAGEELLTGLPEYRNGGLLIDTGLLTLKEADTKRGLEAYRRNAMVEGQPNMEVVPLFNAGDDVIVEWRALTVGFLDELLGEVNRMLGLTSKEDALTLAQMLEAGTWKVSPKISKYQQISRAVADQQKGRPRAGRSLKTKHKRTADHDSFGRHDFLKSLPRRLYMLPSCHSNKTLHPLWQRKSGTCNQHCIFSAFLLSMNIGSNFKMPPHVYPLYLHSCHIFLFPECRIAVRHADFSSYIP